MILFVIAVVVSKLLKPAVLNPGVKLRSCRPWCFVLELYNLLLWYSLTVCRRIISLLISCSNACFSQFFKRTVPTPKKIASLTSVVCYFVSSSFDVQGINNIIAGVHGGLISDVGIEVTAPSLQLRWRRVELQPSLHNALQTGSIFSILAR